MAAVLSTPERRRAPRDLAIGLGLAEAAVLRPGVPVWVEAMSLVGALVASHSPVRPGARTEVAFDALSGERWVVGVTVLRCWVATLSPLRYGAALEFDAALPQGMGRVYPVTA